MARNRISLSFKGFEELAEKLDKAGGDLKKITEKALVAGKNVVRDNLDNAVKNSNFPAQGRYSTGLTEKSIDRDETVEWNGTTGSIHVGFDFKISGMRTIFLMYGTPRMEKSQKIYDAVYGAKTKKQVSAVQKEIFESEIKKIMK